MKPRLSDSCGPCLLLLFFGFSGVYSEMCLRWMGMKQCPDGTGEGKQQSLLGVRVLLKETSLFSIACTLMELWVLASVLFLCTTPRNTLDPAEWCAKRMCCSCAWYRAQCKGRVWLPKSEIISFSLDWYRGGVNVQMCSDITAEWHLLASTMPFPHKLVQNRGRNGAWQLFSLVQKSQKLAVS